MGSHQPSTSSLSGALPVCLYGIGIHPGPQVQPSNYHHQHNNVMRPKHSRRKKTISKQEVSSTEGLTVDQRLDKLTLNEVPLGHDILQERPRHALDLQMADLDKRRKTIRKHISNRGLVNSMEEKKGLIP